MSELNNIVLLEVIRAIEPVGKLAMGVDDELVLMKNVQSEVMWYVAPLSKIQTVFCPLRTKEKALPESSSEFEELPTWLTKEEDLLLFNNCRICLQSSWEKGKFGSTSLLAFVMTWLPLEGRPCSTSAAAFRLRQKSKV